MSEKTYEIPSVNWFGGYFVVRELLLWTKGAMNDSEQNSFLDEMNKRNLIKRVSIVVQSLQLFGETLEAAQAIQSSGCFDDVSAEALAERMQEAVANLRNSDAIWKFRKDEFGSLDFNNLLGDDCDHECNDCDSCEEN